LDSSRKKRWTKKRRFKLCGFPSRGWRLPIWDQLPS
jgi:hypothetical protein